MPPTGSTSETTAARADIVLATLNARYIHAAFGLRYLLANLGDLQNRATLLEFDLTVRPLDAAEAILARAPRIVGLGVYIWNARETAELVAVLKRLRPDLVLILGGPEVSHEAEQQALTRQADYVIGGEADLAFPKLCREILAGQPASPHFIQAPLPDLAQVRLPYELYSDQDLAHRILYVEASRGCPFSCEFCLSSLDVPVRTFPLPDFLAALERLLARGALQFKFVDRTFNLNLNFSRSILEFFLARLRPGLFLHFEMIPDRLPASLREVIERFPPGMLQFEVGIQTFNAAVAERISRRQDYVALAENLRFLREKTGVHIHADLIAGLPGEDLASFAAGFDQLAALQPHEIQLGILKRLRGTPIIRHDADWGMVYAEHPPYEILRTAHLSFAELQALRRMARYWDLIVNSGNFVASAPALWEGTPSAFASFMGWSDWLHQRTGRRHGIALADLAEHLFVYLTQVRRQAPTEVAGRLWLDFQRAGRSDAPPFLREYLPDHAAIRRVSPRQHLPKRQARHAG